MVESTHPIGRFWPAVVVDGGRSTRRVLPLTRRARPRTVSIPAIAERSLVLDRSVRRRLEEVTDELRGFGAVNGAHYVPFASALLVAEVAASCRLEQRGASSLSILRRPEPEGPPSNGAYVRAAGESLDCLLEGPGPTTLAAAHRPFAAVGVTAAGHVRTTDQLDEWRSAAARRSGYTAPAAECIHPSLEDLWAFLARRDVSTLAQGAVAHAQFEAIHPFVAANGPVGRSLIQVQLRARELSRSVVVPVSAGLVADRVGYADALHRYRDGDPDPIVACVVEAAARALENSRVLVRELRGVRSAWDERISVRAGSAPHRLAATLLDRPVLTGAEAERALGEHAENTQAALERLAEDGILIPLDPAADARSVEWAAMEVVVALDAFAARATDPHGLERRW